LRSAQIGVAVAPGADPDPLHAATAGRKQRRLPVEQALGGQRFVVAPRRVQHHLDDTLHIPIRPTDAPGVHAETPRDRGPDLRRAAISGRSGVLPLVFYGFNMTIVH